MPTARVTGQVAIVTGSNVGLGLEAARHLVNMDAAKVILAVRTIEKGEAARTDIETTTNKTGIVEVWKLDMSDYKSVKDFAKKCATLPRLDIVIENAGIATEEYEECQGTERTVVVNVIATFLLALLLLPTLRKSAKQTSTTPRLTIVSSEVHAWVITSLLDVKVSLMR